MSESSRLGLETVYADALRQGEQERISTIKDLDRAIADTRLNGDIAKAQAAMESAQRSADNYAGVLQSLLSRNDTLDYNASVLEREKAAIERENDAIERERVASEKAAARETAFAILQMGGDVSDELLSAAGISRSDADSILTAVKAAQQKETVSASPTMSVSNALSAVKDGYINDTIRSVLNNAGYPDELIARYYQEGAIAAGTPEGWDFYIKNNGIADSNGQIPTAKWQELIDNGANESTLRALGYTPTASTGHIPIVSDSNNSGGYETSFVGNMGKIFDNSKSHPVSSTAPLTTAITAPSVTTPNGLLSPKGVTILNNILSAQKAEGRTGITESEKNALFASGISKNELNLILDLLEL
jgi:hypothetical protein